MAVDAVSLPVSLADGVRTWQDMVLPIIGTSFTDDEFGSPRSTRCRRTIR